MKARSRAIAIFSNACPKHLERVSFRNVRSCLRMGCDKSRGRQPRLVKKTKARLRAIAIFSERVRNIVASMKRLGRSPLFPEAARNRFVFGMSTIQSQRSAKYCEAVSRSVDIFRTLRSSHDCFQDRPGRLKFKRRPQRATTVSFLPTGCATHAAPRPRGKHAGDVWRHMNALIV